MSEGVWVADFNENISFANEKFAEIFWVSVQELRKMNLRNLIDEGSLALLGSETEQRREWKESIYELTIIRSDDRRRLIRVKATPYKDKTGEIVGTRWIFEDITEKKRLERADKAWREISDAFIRALQEDEDLEQALSNLHEILITADLFDTTSLSISILDIETNELRFWYFVDQGSRNPEIIKNIDASDSLFADIIRTGEPRLLRKPEIEALYPGYQSEYEVPEILMALPLKTKDGIMGVVLLQSYADKEAYGLIDVEIMSSISSKIADIVTQKILIQHRIELEQIRRIAASITEETLKAKDQQALFGKIHESVQVLLPNGKARNFYICLIEKEDENDISEDMVIYPYYLDEIDEPPTGSEKLGNNMTSSVIKTGKLIHIPLEETEAFYKDLWIACTGTEPEDWLWVPLYSDDGKVIWAMVVQIYEPKWLRYTKHDEDIVSDIASQVALAIQKKRSMDIIERKEARYRTLTEWLSEWVGIMDVKENFLLENPALKKIFWIPPEGTLEGRNLLDFVHPDDKELIRKNTLDREQWKSSSYEVRITRADGELRYIQINASPEGQGDGFQILAIIRDITEQKAREEQLFQDAMHDPLTGSGSLRALQECLPQEFDRYLRTNKNGASWKLTVGYIDVDNLKKVNNTISHDAGSRLICDVANVLRGIDSAIAISEDDAAKTQKAIRKMDSVFRIGWDEFVMILPECSEENAEKIITPRILAELDRINTFRRNEHFSRHQSLDALEKTTPYLNISISIGFAEFNPEIHKTPEDVTLDADIKMYIRKYTKKARNACIEWDYKAALEQIIEAYKKNARAPEVIRALVVLETEVAIHDPEKIPPEELVHFEKLKIWLTEKTKREIWMSES